MNHIKRKTKELETASELLRKCLHDRLNNKRRQRVMIDLDVMRF